MKSTAVCMMAVTAMISVRYRQGHARVIGGWGAGWGGMLDGAFSDNTSERNSKANSDKQRAMTAL